jgi:hypothetical protein
MICYDQLDSRTLEAWDPQRQLGTNVANGSCGRLTQSRGGVCRRLTYRIRPVQHQISYKAWRQKAACTKLADAVHLF